MWAYSSSHPSDEAAGVEVSHHQPAVHHADVVVNAPWVSARVALTRLPEKSISFISGWVAGLSGIVVAHPFDTLKTRLQIGRTSSHHHFRLSSLTPRYITTLYAGVGPPLLVAGILQSCLFGSFNHFKGYFQGLAEPHVAQARALGSTYGYVKVAVLSGLSVFVSGSCAGLCTSVITCPSGMVKVQQQCSPDLTMLQVIKALIRKGGLPLIFRGYSAHIFMEIFGRGTYFTVYDVVKRELHQTTQSPSPAPSPTPSTPPPSPPPSMPYYKRAAAGMCAGIAGWLVVFPFDVLKSRLQAQPLFEGAARIPSGPQTHLSDPYAFDTSGRRTTERATGHRGWAAPKKYEGFWHCARETWKEGGVRAFYRGLGFTLARAAPVACVVLPVYDVTHETLLRWRNG
ncbi:unnamed protein product [Vitrella brassicaformis CCMP3155]|uniref:Mitochondrial carrier protein n=1 Tax=Vitrella brassicaformis (strain CCMP3155) TaxID=1169540 RepID=A0A0G4FP91_VITBC|nr:unnamed protein product [Vitrella brassicaformis CCMP3155]|eukprot:CEM16029.1 unnamed protein product [Vitrella brassicaformis CCMP3155]